MKFLRNNLKIHLFILILIENYIVFDVKQDVFKLTMLDFIVK